MLGRGALPELHAQELDAAGDRVRPVVRHRDHRRSLQRLGFDAVDRVAERPGRHFLIVATIASTAAP